RRQPRVVGEALDEPRRDAVVAHQRIAEREDEPRRRERLLRRLEILLEHRALHVAHAPTPAAASAPASSAAGTSRGSTGRRMVNVVPRPTSLSTSMLPPCRLTMP